MVSDKEIEKINRIITDYGKILEQFLELYEFGRSLALWIDFMLSYPPQQESIFDGLPSFPRIEDYSPELKRKRMVREVEKTVQRRRKLSAEDMVKMYLLRVDKHLSFRNIAEEFKVNESAVRKVFLKVKKSIDNI